MKIIPFPKTPTNEEIEAIEEAMFEEWSAIDDLYDFLTTNELSALVDLTTDQKADLVERTQALMRRMEQNLDNFILWKESLSKGA